MQLFPARFESPEAPDLSESAVLSSLRAAQGIKPGSPNSPFPQDQRGANDKMVGFVSTLKALNNDGKTLEFTSNGKRWTLHEIVSTPLTYPQILWAHVCGEDGKGLIRPTNICTWENVKVVPRDQEAEQIDLCEISRKLAAKAKYGREVPDVRFSCRTHIQENTPWGAILPLTADEIRRHVGTASETAGNLAQKFSALPWDPCLSCKRI